MPYQEIIVYQVCFRRPAVIGFAWMLSSMFSDSVVNGVRDLLLFELKVFRNAVND